MATTPKVLLKRSSVAGRIPDSSDLQYGELAINFADGKLYYKDDSNNIRAFIDSALVQNLVDQIETVAQSQLDSSEVTVLIDSDYINNRLDTTIVNNLINFGDVLDSAFIISIIDSAYINARADIDSGDVVNIINNTVNATYLSNSIDSSFVTNIVDSAYIQARDRFRDSDFVRSIVDSSYITIINQTTAGSIAESADVTNIIDSAYIQSRQLTVSGSFDSAAISSIIAIDVDKTFVDALNTNADTLDGFEGTYYLNYNNFTNTPVIDSAYVRARADSDYIRGTIDSAFINQYVGGDNTEVTHRSITVDSIGEVDKINFRETTFTDINVPDNLPTFEEGNLFYFQGPDALTYSNDRINVKIAQDEIVRVYNNTGSQIDKGKAVYITGAANDFPTIALAKSDTFETVYETIGLTAHNIPTEEYGFVTMRGLFGGLNTASFSVGAVVHVSPDSAGELVSFNPTHPNFAFEIGVVLVSDSASGGNVGGCIQVNPRTEIFETLRTIGTSRFDGNVTIAGNLNILGTETKTSVASLEVADQFVYVGGGDTIASAVHTGSGLNDATFKGHYKGDSNVAYYVRISDDHSNHDKIQWSFDSNFATLQGFESAGGPTEFTLDSSTPSVALRYGISIQFEAENGHDSGDVWKGIAAPVNVDFGFSGNYNDSANPYTHAGFFRDASDERFKFFNKYNPEPEGNIDVGHSSFEYANVQANRFYGDVTGDLTGDVTGTVSDLSNHTTTNLTEGDNLYYTKARVDSDITALIDSAYINARVSATDSDAVINIIDSAYINARVSTVDSGQVLQIVDSDYIKTVTGIDAATLGGNDSTYYLDYNNFTATPTIPTVDKATIDALGINADQLDGQEGTYYLNYGNFTNTPDVLDSSEIISIFTETISTEGIKNVERIMFVHDSDATVLTVSVASKTTAHRYEGTGSSQGYYVNDIEAPFIQMVPGNKYRFDQAAATNASHPIKFYYEADKTTEYTTNVTTVGTAGSAGAYVEIEITDATPPVLHYQCQNHGYMGNAIFVQTRNLTGFDTDDLSEGSTNLYFTNTRADARADARIAAATTDDLTEGSTNLYYTKTRADSDIASTVQDEGSILNLRITNLITSTVDSAFVQARQIDSQRDSAFITDIIDSAYIQARQSDGGGGGSSITVQDEGVSLSTAATTFNFVGAGVSASGTGAVKTITIPGSSGGGGGGGANGPLVTKFTFTADSAITVFSDSDDNGNVLDYPFTNDNFNVYLNGILLVDSDDYTANDSSTLTLISATDSNDVVQIITFAEAGAATATGVDSAATITLIQNTVDSAFVSSRQTIFERGTLEVNKFIYEADSGQTEFTGADKFGTILTIDPEQIEVYLNGVLMEDTTDFSADSNSVTLTEAADSGYSLTVIETKGRVASSKNTLALSVYEFTADSGQTEFSGDDNSGVALNLTTGISEVFLNGIVLSEAQDYALTNTSVTLNLAADSGDLLTVHNTVSNNVSSVNYREYKFTNQSGRFINGQGMTFGDNSVQVFKNGSLLSQSEYSTVGGQTIYLNSSAILSDTFVVAVYGNGQSKVRIYNFTADSGQTVFTGNDDHNNDLIYAITNTNIVFLNGIALRDSDDYVRTNHTTLTLTQAANTGDELQIITYGHLEYDSSIAIPLERTQFEFTADSGQTAFTGTDDNALTFSYDPGRIDVYKNGLLLNAADFTATNGTSISLTTAADSGDTLSVVRFLGSTPLDGLDSSMVQRIVDSAYVSSVVDSGYILNIVDSNLLVTIVDSNYIASRVTATGVTVQNDGSTLATTGVTLNFTGSGVTASGTGATKTITIDGGGSTDSSAVSALIDSARFNWAEVDSTAETLVIGAKKIVNTKNQTTILTLPTGTLGDEVRIIDGYGNAATNNITITSSQKIIASDSDLILDIDRVAIGLVFYNDSQGWILIEN